MTNQTAAWVYWPPFSRIPGGYPLMYPGSWVEWSKGGSSRSRSCDFRATSAVRTASMARSANRTGTAPESTAHDCAIESILHSSFCADPSGVPSS
jgi:hypothetical protein